jgi:hypothetical protein
MPPKRRQYRPQPHGATTQEQNRRQQFTNEKA